MLGFSIEAQQVEAGQTVDTQMPLTDPESLTPIIKRWKQDGQNSNCSRDTENSYSTSQGSLDLNFPLFLLYKS